MYTRKIKWMTSNGAKEIEVEDAYPYLINQAIGKVVFDVRTGVDACTAADLEALGDNPSGDIEVYIRTVDGELVGEWELVDTWGDFNSGKVEVHKTADGKRTAQVVKVDGLVKEIEQNKANIEFIALVTGTPINQ